MTVEPYRSSPIFDQDSLPAALRASHSTRAGVWGMIRVLEGEVLLTYVDPHRECLLRAGESGRLTPQQLHFVTPRGAIRMRVDFYRTPPDG